jgi:hypothetical protein
VSVTVLSVSVMKVTAAGVPSCHGRHWKVQKDDALCMLVCGIRVQRIHER